MEQTNERGSSHAQSGHGSQQDTGTLASEARAKAGEAAGAVLEEARGFAEEQKAAGADNVARLGNAIHGAADQLGRELPQAAGYMHSAAERLQSASSGLRERSIEEMVGEFTKFARQQPGVAFVGSILAGFALSRFLKSSNADDHG